MGNALAGPVKGRMGSSRYRTGQPVYDIYDRPLNGVVVHLRPGLKLTVRFVIRESEDGRPIIAIRLVGDCCNIISVPGNPAWFMPWEERLQATVPFPAEREELRGYIRDHILWCNRAGASVVQVTDDRIVLTGIHEVLQEWRARARAQAQHAQESESGSGSSSSRDEQRSIWSKGPVLSKIAGQFIELFKWVEFSPSDWAEVMKYKHQWGSVFEDLVKGRRNFAIGPLRTTRLRVHLGELEGGGGGHFDGDYHQKRMRFWSSKL
ncbi:hypothetical protein B0T09DRAFT_361471 [Sordaria sp. MPI-SDFR-AT-0083]|nr:hypothetical protein B0T09DRAFT_361471 [Sordaria sp. MPI-SDFR-AT-0083]